MKYEKHKVHFLLICVLTLISCNDSSINSKFKESDKSYLILEDSFITQNFIRSIETKNRKYNKRIDENANESEYEYVCEIWKQGVNVGVFLSTTYINQSAIEDELRSDFSAFVLGQRMAVLASSDIRYEQNYDIYVPFETFQIHTIYNSDDIEMGHSLNVLNNNKIITVTIMSYEKAELDWNQLFNRIRKI